MLLLLAVRVHVKVLLISVVYKQECLQTFQSHMTWFDLFSNSWRNDCIDMSHGPLNVSKASSAWYFLTVESFLYNLLWRLIITSTPFLLAMSFTRIFKTASCASPSRYKTKAEPWHFLGSSVYMCQILKRFSQSSYVFDWESGGGVLELLDDIAL